QLCFVLAAHSGKFGFEFADAVVGRLISAQGALPQHIYDMASFHVVHFGSLVVSSLPKFLRYFKRIHITRLEVASPFRGSKLGYPLVISSFNSCVRSLRHIYNIACLTKMPPKGTFVPVRRTSESGPGRADGSSR